MTFQGFYSWRDYIASPVATPFSKAFDISMTEQGLIREFSFHKEPSTNTTEPKSQQTIRPKSNTNVGKNSNKDDMPGRVISTYLLLFGLIEKVQRCVRQLRI